MTVFSFISFVFICTCIHCVSMLHACIHVRTHIHTHAYTRTITHTTVLITCVHVPSSMANALHVQNVTHNHTYSDIFCNLWRYKLMKSLKFKMNRKRKRQRNSDIINITWFSGSPARWREYMHTFNKAILWYLYHKTIDRQAKGCWWSK